MFSANLTWTPVVEVGPKGNDKVVSPDSPSEPEGDRVEASSPIGDGVSVRSSNSRKLSVFRWNKVKRSGTSSSSDHGRHGSSSGGSGRPKNAESVAEMPEDTGIVRHELPAAGASQSSPPARPQRLASGSSPSTSFPSRVLPVANGRFDLPTQSPSRYHSPTSIHGSESGVLQPPERQYRMRNLKTPDNEVRSNSESWGGNWRPPEESAPSSRGSIAITDYPDSSPRTTMLSQSRSSILDGLSPPPKSPARPKPASNIADCWPSRPASDNQSRDALQALVRRMASASSATRWNRVTEEWIEPLDARDRQEILLEKDLWLLTELRLRDAALSTASIPIRTSVGPTLPLHAVQRSGRILDVCSRPADLFHLATLQPGARIAHLAPAADSDARTGTEQLSLPHNVASLSLMLAQGVAFPLGDASFDHVRVTPAAVGAFSAPQLKALLRECHRVLAVRGMFELRLVDPTPLDVGPRTARWVESELLVSLESEFRCTRPAVMVPVWAREAGLELMEGGGFGFQDFRVCVGEGATAEEQLEAAVGQLLMRCQFPSVKTWLWDMEACRVECLERATRFRVTTVFGLKA